MIGKKQTILIVEADDNDYWSFEMAFKNNSGGASLFRMHNGHQAIQYLSGEGVYADRGAHPLPSLLVLDLHVPGKSGFEVMEWLRKNPVSPRIPVVVLTSSEDPGDIKRAFDLGANSYLFKPRQYDLYAALVQTIKEYWLTWNNAPTLRHDPLDPTGPGQRV